MIGEHPDRSNERSDFQIEVALRRAGIDLRRDCWTTNATICSPVDGAPTDEQIEFCRPNLQNLLDTYRPSVIIPFGTHATKSLLSPIYKDDGGYAIQRWAGWRIPCQALNAWVCPTYHPAFVRTSSPVEQKHMDEHLLAAAGLVGRPWADPVPDYKNQVTIIMDTREAASAIDDMVHRTPENTPLAVDLETDRLKPDAPDAEVVCCSVSNGNVTLSFPWDGLTKMTVGHLIRHDRPFVASNLQFEERWFLREFGRGANYWYEDTMLRGHWLDCRPAVSGLKFRAFVELGQGSYGESVDGYFDSEGSNYRNRVRKVPMRDLLLYCGMDALLEWKLCR